MCERKGFLYVTNYTTVDNFLLPFRTRLDSKRFTPVRVILQCLLIYFYFIDDLKEHVSTTHHPKLSTQYQHHLNQFKT